MEIDGKQVVLLIELRGVYDGWSIAELEGGALHNRWPPEDRRHAATSQAIANMAARKALGKGDGNV